MMAVRCFYCDAIFDGRDAKVVSTKSSDVWEKWMVCVDCYRPIQDAMNERVL